MSWFEKEPFLKLSPPVRWGILFILTAVLVAFLEWAHLPAALLLGSMIAGILLETGGGKVKVPAVLYWFSQAAIGCLIARVITPQILKAFAGHWPLFLGIMLAVIAASSTLGWIFTRLRLFPDTTAIWGLLPGAASTMMIMADAFGADGRLVAFMQYLRVLFVAVAAAVIARFWFHASSSAAPVIWFPPVHWMAFLKTLIFIVLSIIVGRWSRIPAGGILVPMIGGAILKITGVLPIELPQWFLALAYALLGWNTGLRFTRIILLHAARTLPQTILAVLLLMAFCWGLALVLVKTEGVDPLTAYLATSPGGMDTAAIIAASSKVNMPFVVSMQAARLFIVLMIGPALSRMMARLIVPAKSPQTRL
jgi:uncharacterized protein